VLLHCARALKVLDRHEVTFADALALLMLNPDHSMASRDEVGDDLRLGGRIGTAGLQDNDDLADVLC
jgi:hypothetical protein